MSYNDSFQCVPTFLPQDARWLASQRTPLNSFYSVADWITEFAQSSPSKSLSLSLYNSIKYASTPEYEEWHDKFVQQAQAQAGCLVLLVFGCLYALIPILWIVVRLIGGRVRRKTKKPNISPSRPTYSGICCQIIFFLLAAMMSSLACTIYITTVFGNTDLYQYEAEHSQTDTASVSETGAEQMNCAFENIIINEFNNYRTQIGLEPNILSEWFFEDSGLKYINITDVETLSESISRVLKHSLKVERDILLLEDDDRTCSSRACLTEQSANAYYVKGLSLCLSRINQDIHAILLEGHLNQTLLLGLETQFSFLANMSIIANDSIAKINSTQCLMQQVVNAVVNIGSALNEWSNLISISTHHQITSESESNSSASKVFLLIFFIIMSACTLIIAAFSITVLVFNKRKSGNCINFRNQRVIEVVWYCTIVASQISFIISIVAFSFAYPPATLCNSLDLQNGASSSFYGDSGHGNLFNLPVTNFDGMNTTINEGELLRVLPNSKTLFSAVSSKNFGDSLMTEDQILQSLSIEESSAAMCHGIEDSNLSLVTDYMFEADLMYDSDLLLNLNRKMLKLGEVGFLPETVEYAKTTGATNIEQINALIEELYDLTAEVTAVSLSVNKFCILLRQLDSHNSPTSNATLVMKNAMQLQVQQVFAEQKIIVNQKTSYYMNLLINELYDSQSVYLNYINPTFTFCQQYRPTRTGIFFSEGIMALSLLLTAVLLRYTRRAVKMQQTTNQEYATSPLGLRLRNRPSAGMVLPLAVPSPALEDGRVPAMSSIADETIARSKWG